MKQARGMKETIGIILCTSILFTGCGKQSEVKVEQGSETIQDVTHEGMGYYNPESNALAKKEMQDKNQMVYDESAPAMEELAFVDEDTNKDNLANTQDVEIINLAENTSEDKNYSLSWEENNREKVAFAPLKFVFDSDKLVDGQKEVLAANIQKAKMAAEKGEDVALNAYACQLGEETYNLALTQRRANTMKEVYVKAGVPEDKLVAVGRGQANPVVFSNATDRLQRIKELEANRRLEMEVISAENA